MNQFGYAQLRATFGPRDAGRLDPIAGANLLIASDK